ncbi:hypothetical protein ACFYST_00700 [Kitasatospora sp. NPDC004614]|uniref:hypothetical protein n=1 Tax=unclassified Kitasatospora TaxID=2633591 RepID=UPI0036D196B2
MAAVHISRRGFDAVDVDPTAAASAASAAIAIGNIHQLLGLGATASAASAASASAASAAPAAAPAAAASAPAAPAVDVCLRLTCWACHLHWFHRHFEENFAALRTVGDVSQSRPLSLAAAGFSSLASLVGSWTWQL